MGNLRFRHGGNIYEAKRRYKKNVLDFSASINPLGLPPYIKRFLTSHFDCIEHYPDPDAKEIRKTIGKYWNISEENVLLGNGSAELIYLVAACYRPKRVLIPSPSFSEYERAAKNAGCKATFLKLSEGDGFRLNLKGIKNADMVFLCNPNNPTGNLIAEKKSILEHLTGKVLVADEAFMDFLPNEREHTLINDARKRKNIIVLRTFTKFFALPGLRIGYLVAHKDTVRRLKAGSVPWNVNSLASLAAGMLMKDRPFIGRTRLLIKKERSFLKEKVAGIKGLEVYPSNANFLLLKIKKNGLTSKTLTRRLLGENIMVRNCDNFRMLGKRFIRVAVRSRKENTRLVKALRESV